MPKVNQESCVTCEYFQDTAKYYYICGLEGIDNMLKNKTWPQFNSDFNSGILLTNIPDWCPKQKKVLLLEHTQTKTEDMIREEGITLPSTCIRGLNYSFETISIGNKFKWVLPTFIEKELRTQLNFLIKENGKGPFELLNIVNNPEGVSMFEFMNTYGRLERLNMYFFLKYHG